MATVFDNVLLASFSEKEQFKLHSEVPHKLEIFQKAESLVLKLYNGNEKATSITVNNDTEYSRLGKQSVVFTNGDNSMLLQFPSIHAMKSFQHQLKELKKSSQSVFSSRTDEASAVQYFQFYGYLSQQQNMMQDYIRTSTYQRAVLGNITDFHDKVVLDVGAGSGILSFFAIQAGAKKVYAIEASNMAEHCERLVQTNNLSSHIVVIPGKVEEVNVPELVDTIISEPMGYMLFNERMLESFLHAKKWLKPGGKMFPSQGDLHIAPFTDESLYMEQYSKANFWYQESFHGVNLTSLRTAALDEYFRQPVVDTFDIRICLAKPNKHEVNFQKVVETDLHVIEIPLSFTIMTSGMVHGLAFWFDVAFFGSDAHVWLSTSPTEPLTHWYQVRCLIQTPILVKLGQTLTGKVTLRCNCRQSYDVDIELNIPGSTNKSVNTLDLKNPFFRYTGQPPQAPPGTSSSSATSMYWNSVQGQTYVNDLLNGMSDPNQALNLQGVVQTNLIAVSNVAPINPGSIPSVSSQVANSYANRTSIGGGISPVNFSTNSQSVLTGTSSNYPVCNQFMIGDYAMPGNLVLSSGYQKSQAY
ncbi:histone-arginine methyltransferase CARMER-like [Gigantopelta aegis]|uniref:histone-arginine methyltransferase CARMER-like n=1 Tax=Gigantopelta aegis TaxID=1735272 RepID=UPI001B8890A6|nr:histone-arginine methyltransferase CARMER-like [Gigantopelta aegis]